LPAESELELLDGPLEDELSRLARENVQSLLLEGGTTLAGAFFRAGLVDKVLLFVAPKLSGEGPGLVPALTEPSMLTRLRARRIGQDVLLTAYVHEP
jgi:diaminohydroxyphosphoribosylaminopyrimidine deaminase/5-amino-6-(5-phosphoribosylamino)uracil reductase